MEYVAYLMGLLIGQIGQSFLSLLILTGDIHC